MPDRVALFGIFQWLLTLGIVSAAVIGIYYSYRVAEITHTASPEGLFLVKSRARRQNFWMTMPRGVLFMVGSLFVAESPRWLYKRGNKEMVHAALLRSDGEEQAQSELREMDVVALSAHASSSANTAENNSIITDILLQSGLSDVRAHNNLPSNGSVSLAVIYSYGRFTATTSTVRSDDVGAARLQINRASCVPSSKVEAFFRNPFVSLEAARAAPLRIEHAYIAPIASVIHAGSLLWGCMLSSLFTRRDRVCVAGTVGANADKNTTEWNEHRLGHQPARFHSAGCDFLPVVGKYGYSTMYFLFTLFTFGLPVDGPERRARRLKRSKNTLELLD